MKVLDAKSLGVVPAIMHWHLMTEAYHSIIKLVAVVQGGLVTEVIKNLANAKVRLHQLLRIVRQY